MNVKYENLTHNDTFQFEMASLIPKTKKHFRFFYLLAKEVTITMTTLMSAIIEELQSYCYTFYSWSSINQM